MMTRTADDAVQPDFNTLCLCATSQMADNPPAASTGNSPEGTRRGGRRDTSEEQQERRITGFEDQANSDLASVQPLRRAQHLRRLNLTNNQAWSLK
jgi:hypothetical protein